MNFFDNQLFTRKLKQPNYVCLVVSFRYVDLGRKLILPDVYFPLVAMRFLPRLQASRVSLCFAMKFFG